MENDADIMVWFVEKIENAIGFYIVGSPVLCNTRCR